MKSVSAPLLCRKFLVILGEGRKETRDSTFRTVVKRIMPSFLGREEKDLPLPKLAPTKLASQPPSSRNFSTAPPLYTLCSRIIFHSNKSTQPPPPPTMKFNNVNLLLSTSAAVIATAPLVSGQVSFMHSIVCLSALACLGWSPAVCVSIVSH